MNRQNNKMLYEAQLLNRDKTKQQQLFLVKNY